MTALLQMGSRESDGDVGWLSLAIVSEKPVFTIMHPNPFVPVFTLQRESLQRLNNRKGVMLNAKPQLDVWLKC